MSFLAMYINYEKPSRNKKATEAHSHHSATSFKDVAMEASKKIVGAEKQYGKAMVFRENGRRVSRRLSLQQIIFGMSGFKGLSDWLTFPKKKNPSLCIVLDLGRSDHFCVGYEAPSFICKIIKKLGWKILCQSIYFEHPHKEMVNLQTSMQAKNLH